MKIISLLLILITSTTVSAEKPSESLSVPEYSPGELLVKISSDGSPEEFRILNHQMNVYSAKRVFLNLETNNSSLSRIYIIRFSQDASVEELTREYSKSRLIEDVQPNYFRKTCVEEVIPNDEKLEEMWHIEKIGMTRAWTIEKGSPEVVIAVIDGGIDSIHPDLTAKLWKNEDEIPSNLKDDDKNGYVDDYVGWDFTDVPTVPGIGDFVERDNEPMEKSGHGTHVAGIAGAEVNNQIGVAGVAWRCKIMAIRAGAILITGGSRLQDDDSAASIVYAADNGAHVISMSWGDYEDSFIIKDAVDYAYQKGCILVGAAGNDSSQEVIYPAGYNNVIAVASTNQLDERYHNSNYGSVIDICAPGNQILSTYLDKGYRNLTGTSMATPQVAASAALVLSKRPGLTNEEVRQILVYSADAVVDSPELVGAKRLNVAKALLSSSSLQAKIVSPGSREGGDSSIEIVGNAGGFKFSDWKLEYGKSKVPETWFDITTGKIPKFNERIYLWDTSQIDEGVYTIRLQTNSRDKSVQDEIIVYIDHIPPKIIELDASQWLINEYQTTKVSWRTDDLAYSELYFRPYGSGQQFEHLSTNVIDKTNLFSLSNILTSGDYEYYVSSKNLAGLKTVDDNNGNFYQVSVLSDVVSPTEFVEKETALPAMYSPRLRRPDLIQQSAFVDFDGDSLPEIVGVEYDSVSPVRIYERTDDGYDIVFESSERYLPLELCELDGDGRWEILGGILRERFLLEAPTQTGSYPVRKVWEAKGCLRSRTAELNSNGMGEIVTFTKFNEIVIYEALSDNNYEEIARLSNPTDGENTMETDSAVSDLDEDGRIELVVADSDGELFAYENIANNRFSHVWTVQTNIRRNHEMDAGDIDGDGRPELVVGGIVLDENNSPIYWQYTIFKSTGNNQIQKIFQQKFQNFYPNTKYDVLIEDFDKDNYNELLTVVPPNAYIFEHEDSKIYTEDTVQRTRISSNTHHASRFTFHAPHLPSYQLNDNYLTPVWHSKADEGPAVFSSEVFYFNLSQRFTRFSQDTSNYNQYSPYALTAIPLNEKRVVLYWKVDSPQNSYAVYRGITDSRKSPPSFLKQIATNISGEEFTDNTVKQGKTYWYVISISSLYQEQIPIEEVEDGLGLSELASAIPDFPPKLKSVKYLSPDRISLEFDKHMNSSVRDINLYSLIELDKTPNDRIHPSSAILIETGHKVLLTFDEGILLPGHSYRMIIRGLRSKNRVSLDSPHEEQFTVPESSSLQFLDLSRTVVYPNPVRPNEHNAGHITFANLPVSTKIRIYDINGILLEVLEVTEANKGKKLWYLTNKPQYSVSSGIYLYTLEFNSELKSGKIAVIK